MLRRRSKSPRVDKRPPKAGPVGHASRRRAREDTPVPSQLLLPPGGLPAAAPQKPRKAKDSAERVVLVTGFDPFAGEQINPSWEICKRMPREIAGLRVETCRVPCEFRRA